MATENKKQNQSDFCHRDEGPINLFLSLPKETSFLFVESPGPFVPYLPPWEFTKKQWRIKT
jgi:hypothetical protein